MSGSHEEEIEAFAAQSRVTDRILCDCRPDNRKALISLAPVPANSRSR
jgi:hypothetical protein